MDFKSAIFICDFFKTLNNLEIGSNKTRMTSLAYNTHEIEVWIPNKRTWAGKPTYRCYTIKNLQEFYGTDEHFKE